jgi:predicted GNAT family acetyltransferase
MAEITISHTAGQSKGRYEAQVAGHQDTGEVTYSRVSGSLIIADHTFVPTSLRGLGVAQALVSRLIGDARLRGERIVPLCPFVRAYAAKRHEELADVIQW